MNAWVWSAVLGGFAAMWSHTLRYRPRKSFLFGFFLVLVGNLALDAHPAFAAALCRILIGMSVGAAIAFIFAGMIERKFMVLQALWVAVVLFVLWMVFSARFM